jgi:hypothetical protein
MKIMAGRYRTGLIIMKRNGLMAFSDLQERALMALILSHYGAINND